MIEYSVFMTSNHLSQDKGPKAYAAGQVRDKLTTDKFVAHVASHNCSRKVLSRAFLPTLRAVCASSCLMATR